MILEFGIIYAALCVVTFTSADSNVKRQQTENTQEFLSASSGCTKLGFEVSPQVWICPNTKPLKPNRALEQEKKFCAPTFGICTLPNLNKALTKWSQSKRGPPKGCYAFRMSEKKKAGGMGSSCHKNLYFDGVLCCPKLLKKNYDKKSPNRREKLFYKSSHFIHNLVK